MDQDGALHLETERGLQVLSSGEILSLRPA